MSFTIKNYISKDYCDKLFHPFEEEKPFIIALSAIYLVGLAFCARKRYLLFSAKHLAPDVAKSIQVEKAVILPLLPQPESTPILPPLPQPESTPILPPLPQPESTPILPPLLRRELEAARLKEAILAPFVRFIFILGEFESGKTTLINQVISEFAASGNACYDATKLKNLIDRNKELEHIKSLNENHPGKVIVTFRSIDKYDLDAICEFVKISFPHDVTCLFECDSDANKKNASDFLKGVKIFLPPLSTAQKYEILLKGEEYFQKMCGIPVPPSVVEEVFASVSECKNLSLNGLYSTFSRACVRAKGEGKQVVDSEIVKAIFFEDRRDSSQVPKFLVKVEGCANLLARNDERKLLLNNIAFRNVLLVAQSGYMIDALLKSLALDIANKKIPEFSQVYAFSQKEARADSNWKDKLKNFIERVDERIILFVDDINDYYFSELEKVMPFRCLRAATSIPFQNRFYPLEVASCDEALTKLYFWSKKERFSKTDQVAIPEKILNMVVNHAGMVDEVYPNNALKLFREVVSQAKSERAKTLNEKHVESALEKLGFSLSKSVLEEEIL